MFLYACVGVFRSKSAACNAIEAAVSQGRQIFGRRSPELISPLLTHITLTRTSLCKCFLDQIVPDSHINSPRCLLALSAAGSEGLVHQPQHGDREERPLAHRGGPGGLSVRTVTAGSSDWSPQLLQECLQVGNSSPGDGWRLRFSYTGDYKQTWWKKYSTVLVAVLPYENTALWVKVLHWRALSFKLVNIISKMYCE